VTVFAVLMNKATVDELAYFKY